MNFTSFNAKLPPVLMRHWLNLTVCVLAIACIPCAAANARQTSRSGDASIPAAHLLRPAELARLLRAPNGEKPLILQVGSHVMFAEAHIPGSEYAGAGGQESGLRMLRERLKDVPRSRFIVIYCGCCPWPKCPNIRPAYRLIASMGFTRVKALYIEDNFGADWVAKGYPVAKGD